MTLNSISLIGLTGFARSGKDTFFKFANAISGTGLQRFAFADELKKECDAFLLENTGISSWTEDPEEKSIIRPFLVAYGTHVRRKLNKNCWIDKIRDDVMYWVNSGNTAVVTDVRYLNEVEWIKEEGGRVVNISRTDIGPANNEEREQAELMNAHVDYFLHWPTYGEALHECTSQVRECIMELETKELSLSL